MEREQLYLEASETYEAAIERLVRAYEADAAKQADLLQDIHIALWKSFERFEGRCSLRTWVYRVAHHTAASYVIQQKRTRLSQFTSLEELDRLQSGGHSERGMDDRMAIDRLLRLIHRLRPLDREVMLLYLEDLDAASIGEITGISPGNVRNKIYRIKMLLARQFHGGDGA